MPLCLGITKNNTVIFLASYLIIENNDKTVPGWLPFHLPVRKSRLGNLRKWMLYTFTVLARLSSIRLCCPTFLFFFLKLTLVMNILCVAMRHTCSWKHKKDKEPKPASHWAFANNLEKQVCWGELNSFRGTLAFQSDRLDVIWITTTIWHHERIIELNRAWNECWNYVYYMRFRETNNL